MHHFGMEDIINEKKREVERISREGWKVRPVKTTNTSFLAKIKRQFFSSSSSSSQKLRCNKEIMLEKEGN
ncbi:hypothetical protein SAMN05421736_1297 [Evansella caseinilytica]|uniref:Uncharacterized protein n=1 Tax=Evansella caseinilytica TaxID=1503961 RepID=A0A1H3UYN4_9BACI|nr:hypothetical protein SAMN05421736_1297 [Evansella caseinilytica]